MRLLFRALIVAALLGAGGFLPALAVSTYYIAPNGNDANPGSEAQPWKTWPRAISTGSPKLAAGDTLIVLDGNYTIAENGRFLADCNAGANNGTETAPITVRAQNERKPFLLSDGTRPNVRIENCTRWVIEGLYGRQVDNPSIAGQVLGQNIMAQNSSFITFRRNLTYGCNRYWNVSQMTMIDSTDGLMEENEGYFCHRKIFSYGGGSASARSIMRRNYGHGRSAADVCSPYTPGVCEGSASNIPGTPQQTADAIFQVAYPGNDMLAENNIAENYYIGFSVDANNPAQRNRLLGNIAVNPGFTGSIGIGLWARGTGISRMPVDTVLANNVIVSSGSVAFWMRSNKNTQATNMTILASANNSGVLADKPGAEPGDGAPSVFLTNMISAFHATNGFAFDQQSAFGLLTSNAFSNSPNFFPSSSSNYQSNTTVDPQLGTCKAWIPAGSPMKGTGTCTAAMIARGECTAGVADKGANILYRYQDGILTTTPLWNTTTGEFPRGALVAGVNDIAGSSLFDVHIRLNINTGGCSFPAGFGTVPPPPPSPPPNTNRVPVSSRPPVSNPPSVVAPPPAPNRPYLVVP